MVLFASGDYRTFVELQSLAFTVPLLVLAFLVIYESVPAFLGCSKGTPMWWMVLGIILGFIGGFFDSFYWGFPWSFHYLGLPMADVLNVNGVYSNLVFRQGFGIAAAYCHLRAFIAPSKDSFRDSRLMRILHYFVVMSLVAGQLYVLTLYLVKNGYLNL